MRPFRHVTVAAAAVLGLGLLSPPAGAQPWAADQAEASGKGLQTEGPRRAETRGATTRYYDERGRSAGRAERRGATTRLYDGRGRYAGRVESRGNTARAYDARGRTVGRAERR